MDPARAKGQGEGVKRAILNVAVGKWYPRGSARLRKSLIAHGESAHKLFYVNRYPPGCPPHDHNPYAFKPYAFLAAAERGFDQALWLDSSVELCRPLNDVWNWIEEDGYCFGNDGWFVGQWANERSLEKMDLTREEAWDIPLMDGKIIGLNLRHPKGLEFLRQWKDYADKGVFRGAWHNHRHDITAGAVVAHRMGLQLRNHFLTMGECKGDTYIRAGGM